MGKRSCFHVSIANTYWLFYMADYLFYQTHSIEQQWVLHKVKTFSLIITQIESICSLDCLCNQGKHMVGGLINEYSQRFSVCEHLCWPTKQMEHRWFP